MAASPEAACRRQSALWTRTTHQRRESEREREREVWQPKGAGKHCATHVPSSKCLKGPTKKVLYVHPVKGRAGLWKHPGLTYTCSIANFCLSRVKRQRRKAARRRGVKRQRRKAARRQGRRPSTRRVVKVFCFKAQRRQMFPLQHDRASSSASCFRPL